MKNLKSKFANIFVYFGAALAVLGEKIAVIGFSIHKKLKTDTGVKIMEAENLIKNMLETLPSRKKQTNNKLTMPAEQNTGENDAAPNVKPFIIKTPGNS